jgi:methionyl-tRNA formyltransferase
VLDLTRWVVRLNFLSTTDETSILQQLRGCFVALNGEKETGVTTFKLQHEIDTGDILLQESFPIADDDNVSIVHDRMMELGASVLVKTVKGLADGSIQEKPQIFADNASEESLKHAPKIFTETCEIKFDQTIESVYNIIRGLSPYPAAFTFLHGKKLKIYTGQKFSGNTISSPGTLHSDEKTFLHFACTDGYIAVLDLQLEGKKRMPVADFLRGYRFPDSK